MLPSSLSPLTMSKPQSHYIGDVLSIDPVPASRELNILLLCFFGKLT